MWVITRTVTIIIVNHNVWLCDCVCVCMCVCYTLQGNDSNDCTNTRQNYGKYMQICCKLLTNSLENRTLFNHYWVVWLWFCVHYACLFNNSLCECRCSGSGFSWLSLSMHAYVCVRLCLQVFHSMCMCGCTCMQVWVRDSTHFRQVY